MRKLPIVSEIDDVKGQKVRGSRRASRIHFQDAATQIHRDRGQSPIERVLSPHDQTSKSR